MEGSMTIFPYIFWYHLVFAHQTVENDGVAEQPAQKPNSMANSLVVNRKFAQVSAIILMIKKPAFPEHCRLIAATCQPIDLVHTNVSRDAIPRFHRIP